MADIGASLMGRITYDMVLGFGITPSASAPLLVASSRQVVSEHASVRGVSGDIAGMIEQAHAGANGRDVSLDGGTLIRQASDAGLIDEMTLTIVPVVLGAGTPLFAGAEQRRRFELVSSQVLGSSLVQLRYRRAILASSLASLILACGQPSSDDSSSQTTASSTETSTSTETETSAETDETDTAEPDLPEPPPPPDPMVVMTFNVLCSFCDDTYDPWEDRINYISDTIARHDPDLVGLQELFTAEEVQQLLDLNPEYEALFYSDETIDYADATIWWRADRYELIDSGFYWLSPTPDVPLSVGFSPPQLARMVAWAQLRELSTEAELLFVDTHFDNNSPSQELSAPLLLERTEAQAGPLPIIVVGDFNSRPDTTAYAILSGGVAPGEFALTNSFDLAQDWSVDSNEDPVPAYDPAIRIDHMWVAGGEWSVPWWVVDTWIYGANDLHTSDHFAMATELHFEG